MAKPTGRGSASTIEPEKIVDSDSMSPASLGIWEKLSYKRALNMSQYGLNTSVWPPPVQVYLTNHQVMISGQLCSSLHPCPRHTAKWLEDTTTNSIFDLWPRVS